ncbi:MAG: hypothetical protein ACRYGG_09435 [Janthinobacterium lividum]
MQLEPSDRIDVPPSERDAARVLTQRFAACGNLSDQGAASLYAGLRKLETAILQEPVFGADAMAFREASSVSQWLESLFALRKFSDSRPTVASNLSPRNITTCHPSHTMRIDAMRRFLGERVRQPSRRIPVFSDFQRYNEMRWLESWIDWGRAAKLASRPLQLLNAIFAQDGATTPQPLPDIEDPQYGAHREQFLFSAFALALNRLETGSFLQGFVNDRFDIDHQGLLRTARSAVRKAVAAQHLADRLIGLEPIPSTPGRPRHDGFSFCAARGLNPEQVRQTWLVGLPPAGAARAQADEAITQRLEQLGESTLYPIGTPEQSMHSALLRVYAANALPVPSTWLDKHVMRQAFNEIVGRWAMKAVDYPIAPELLAAMHLQAAYGIDFEQMAEELNLVDGNNWAPRATDASATNAAHNRDTSVMPGSTDPIQQSSPHGVNTDLEKAACAIEWLRGRTMARFDSPAPFDATQAAIRILLAAGHSLSDINHHYPRGLFINVGPMKTRVRIGYNLPEAFLWAMRRNEPMETHIVMDAAALMEAEIDAYLRGLIESGWLGHHALEFFRERKMPITAALLTSRMKKELANRTPAIGSAQSDIDLGALLLDLTPIIGSGRALIDSAKDNDPLSVAWNTAMLGADLVFFGSPILRRALAAGKTFRNGLRGLPLASQMALRAAGKATDLFDTVKASYAIEKAAAPPMPTARIYAIQRPVGPRKAHETLQRTLPGDAQTPMESDHFIAKLSNDGRLVRLEPIDAHFRELDMATGRPIEGADPVYLDPLDRNYYSRPALREDPFIPPLIRDSATFNERITIVQVRNFLSSRPDFDRKAARKALNRMFTIDMDESTAARVSQYLQMTLENSWDFVRLLNAAERRKEAWRIVIEDRPVTPHTSFDTKRIVLTPPGRRNSLSPYMSPRGETPTTFEQAIDHEVMHAITGNFDPDRGRNGLTHRGGVSYFAARIAFDRGDVALPRVMYAHPLPPHLAVQARPHENPSRLFVQAAHETAIEDRLLDRLLDNGRPPAMGNEIIFGTELARRPAVAGFESVASLMMDYAEDLRAWPGDRANLAAYFDFGGSSTERAHTQILFNSIKGSNALVNLAAPWIRAWRPSDRRWTLIWRTAESSTAADTDARTLFDIDDANRQIVFHSQGMVYLSEIDLRPVEPARQLLLGLVSLFAPILAADDQIIASGANAYSSRSSLTTLVDDILLHFGCVYPRQIARQLAGPFDAATGHRLTESISDVRRAADKEDNYLVSRWSGSLSEQGVDCRCSVLR